MENKQAVHVGFTGTREEITSSQKTWLQNTLLKHYTPGSFFHHGDCQGADAAAHDLAEEIGYTIIIHPPKNPKERAFKKANCILKEKSYLDRNKDIVDESSILLAVPKGPEEIRSGTWSTVRYARGKNKQIETATW